MTIIWQTKESFASDALSAFCELNRALVRRVPGGVVRTKPASPGKVAVFVGGGSGHYPAFAGHVGKGLVDAPPVATYSQPVRTSAVHHVSGNGARLPATVATAKVAEHPET